MESTDGETTPLLRGRPAEEAKPSGRATFLQPAGDEGGASLGSGEHSALRWLRAISSYLLLAVLAIAAGTVVAMFTIGLIIFMMPNTVNISPTASDNAILPESTPKPNSGTARHPSGPVTGIGEVEARGSRQGGAIGAGSTEHAGSEGSSGGWRSQADGLPGIAARNTRGGGEGEASKSSATANTKPNVFFLLIDDMGYGDIGYQSTDLDEISPNLDKLAAGGVKLTNYYSMALCSPARASIMTGRYPVRYGMQYTVVQAGAPWGLPLNEKILPQYMNGAGYESHMVGKWHLGGHKLAALPNQRGFKSYLGYLYGSDTYYTHKNPQAEFEGRYFFDLGYGNATGYHDVTKSNIQGASCSNELRGPSWDDDSHDSLDPPDVCYTGTYSTDIFVGRARQIVQSKTPFDEEPLFLYLAHQAVHSPLGPAPWDAFTPEEQHLLDAVRNKTGSAVRAKFAGVLMFLDKRIGAFVDMLEQEGWLENSVIVVASDNGGCPVDGGSNYPLRGTKQSVYEGGRKVPAFVWSKSHLPSEVWGTSYDKIMHSTDWVPTLASLTGAELSGGAGVLDGVDQWPWLSALSPPEADDGSNDPRKEVLHSWDYVQKQEGKNVTQGAYRLGNWKLLLNVWCTGYYSHDLDVIENDPLLDPEVACSRGRACDDCAGTCDLEPDMYTRSNKLFNIKDDPREEHDLYDQYPEIVEQIRQRAEEVVKSEWTPAGLVPVNHASYEVWAENGWWISPWEEILEGTG